jgi:proteasome beta subunit
VNPTSKSSYTGAISVGIWCSDGVILGSDTRIIDQGIIKSRSGRKIFKITDKIGVAFSGKISEIQKINQELNSKVRLYNLEKSTTISVKIVAKLASNIISKNIVSPPEIIIGGMDGIKPSLYLIDQFGGLIQEKFAAIGQGSTIAIGILENKYNENIDYKKGREIVEDSIRASIKRNISSGDGIDLLIISKENIYEETIEP